MFFCDFRIMEEIKKTPSGWGAIKHWTRKILGFTGAKLAFKTGLAASLSLILGLAFGKTLDRPDILVSGLWCVLASIVVMQAHLGGTYHAAWIRFLGVIVGSIAGGVFLNWMEDTPFRLGVSVFCTLVICAILNLRDSFRIAGLSTAIIVVIGGLHPEINPWMFALYRFIDSCIGIFVAVFVARIIWPEKAVETIRLNIIKSLDLLGKYYRLVTNPEPENQLHMQAADSLLVEIAELLQENQDLKMTAEMELFTNQPKRERWALLTDQLDEILESIIAARNVRKDTLSKIFDDTLANQVADAIDKTDLAFQDLAKMMSLESRTISFDALKSSLKMLNEELLRFRATRATRKFNIEDVESFFVFFYSLRSIGEAIIKMGDHVKELP